MTVRSSPDVPFFLVDGRDVLGTLTEITHNNEALVEETHTLGDAWVERTYVGVRRGEISQTGFYDDGANSVHELLSNAPGSTRVICYGLEGTATGAAFVGFSGAVEINYERQVSRGALHKAMARYAPSGAIDEGKIIRTLKISSASGNSSATPVDNGASSTGTGAAYLQVSRIDSIGTMTVKLRHSSDNVAFADLVTFTGNTSANTPSGERKAITATAIERYVYEDRAFATAAAGASATYMTGLVRSVR